MRGTNSRIVGSFLDGSMDECEFDFTQLYSFLFSQITVDNDQRIVRAIVRKNIGEDIRRARDNQNYRKK